MLDQMVEQFDSWVQQLGSLGYLLLGAAALLEYLIPPFPGDTVTMLGGAYAVRGEKSVVLVFVAVTVGSMIGLAGMYAVGRLVGSRIDAQPEGTLFIGISHAKVRQLQEQMRTRGTWLLVANRFFPTFRALMFVAAGAARMPFGKVMLLGTLSAMAWNVGMLAIGYTVGRNVEKLTALLSQYNRVALGVIAVAVLALVIRYFVKKRKLA